MISLLSRGILWVILCVSMLAADDGSDFFETSVRPVLANQCCTCHGSEWSVYEVSDYLGCGSYGSRVVPEVECTS